MTKNVISCWVRILSLPFLSLLFIWSFFSVLREAKKYAYQKEDSKPFGERFKKVAKLICFYLYLRGIYSIVNFENELPKHRPVLIVCNHKSWLDPLALICAIYKNRSKKDNQFQFTFVAKMELKNKLIGKILSYIDCVFIDRQNLRQTFQCFNEQVQLLQKNISICVFPEGTRVQGNVIGECKSAAIKVALKSFVPILPAAIYCSKKMNQRSRFNFFVISPIHIFIQFGYLVDTFQYAEANPDFLMNNLRNKIYIMYETMRLQTLRLKRKS